MKFTIDTDLSVLSSRQLAVFVWLLTGITCILGWPFKASWMRLILGLAGLLFGVLIAAKRLLIVSHRASPVLQQLHDTLQSTCIPHQVLDNSIHVNSTGTNVSIQAFGRFTLVEFHVVDAKCNKERFLVELLTKCLRFAGKESADG